MLAMPAGLCATFDMKCAWFVSYFDQKNFLKVNLTLAWFLKVI